jgi:cellulose synthase/poly-beta-1,6-N-acetylglucosamine synthase-like glycosyltransferase
VEIFGWAYFLISIWLAIYGVNALFLVILFVLRRIRPRPTVEELSLYSPDWPEVTVQLPIYNEPEVVRRLIDAAARLDYPRNRLVIQVLDDSTDETSALAAEQVRYWASRGRRILHIRRGNRSEYKAGALKYGMAISDSEYFAIFDADFLPPAHWLQQAMRPFFGPQGAAVGMVQTRWTHLNERYSLLTRAQALLLDGHFGVEQRTRSEEGFFFGFNGTAGIWRRQCIEDAGGWRGITLSEDLDLSYRAQIAGWKFSYLPNVVAPAELPATMAAFRIQQARWAKGSIQAVRFLAPQLLCARINIWKKLEGLIHITGYLVHPLMVLMVLLSLPLVLGGNYVLKDVPMAWIGIASLGAPMLFITAESSLYMRQAWWRRVSWMPLLMMLGVGVAFSNTRAVLAGVFNIKSPFQRTPKMGSAKSQRLRRLSFPESSGLGWNTLAEIGLSGYALFACILNVDQSNWIGASLLLAYATGFAWVAGASLWEAATPLIQRMITPKRLNVHME